MKITEKGMEYENKIASQMGIGKELSGGSEPAVEELVDQVQSLQVMLQTVMSKLETLENANAEDTEEPIEEPLTDVPQEDFPF